MPTQPVLERLEINLRNFGEEIASDVTPSSEASSLPTPDTEPSNLSDVEIQPHPHSWQSLDFGESRIEPPGAPLLKDYDSFTEGSARGSFESLASWGEQDLNDSVYTVTSAPKPTSTNDTSSYIEEWREQVSSTATAVPHTPSKRPRSPSVGEERRIRPRAGSLSQSQSPWDVYSQQEIEMDDEHPSADPPD
ncbi:hypothetical protein BDN72DRAFT_834800 [Pluteus cervinus]|uniref:Uncharacterized protein n=1 Tax=Pluteus cervinus TaxID=181527 RepID=A0ACD3B5Q6_9AGAR|nr:hypothetical protein BDN72DRAFT_834800 [Pluteus cervinus]